MDKQLKAIVDGLTDEQRERLAREDRLRAGLGITMFGMDITALPSLPPELRKEEARQPEQAPPGSPPRHSRRRRRG